MNKIVKTSTGYVLTCDNGENYLCTRWFERKTGEWHIKLPADNPSGRLYVREKRLENTDSYEFETKTDHRIGLNTSWKSKMTEEEAIELAQAEATIERIKNACMSRETVKLTRGSVEWYEAEILKYQAKLAKIKENQ